MHVVLGCKAQASLGGDFPTESFSLPSPYYSCCGFTAAKPHILSRLHLKGLQEFKMYKIKAYKVVFFFLREGSDMC